MSTASWYHALTLRHTVGGNGQGSQPEQTEPSHLLPDNYPRWRKLCPRRASIPKRSKGTGAQRDRLGTYARTATKESRIVHIECRYKVAFSGFSATWQVVMAARRIPVVDLYATMTACGNVTCGAIRLPLRELFCASSTVDDKMCRSSPIQVFMICAWVRRQLQATLWPCWVQLPSRSRDCSCHQKGSRGLALPGSVGTSRSDYRY